MNEKMSRKNSNQIGDMLPCPFCGGAPEIIAGRYQYGPDNQVPYGFWMQCSMCACELGNNSVGLIDGYTQGLFRSTEEAMKAWNSRTT